MSKNIRVVDEGDGSIEVRDTNTGSLADIGLPSGGELVKGGNEAEFAHSVSVAMAVRAPTLRFPRNSDILARENGRGVEIFNSIRTGYVPEGGQTIEVLSNKIQYSVSVDGESFEVVDNPGGLDISFRESVSVIIGVQFPSDRRVPTITTTKDFDDVAQAVSLMSSSLKSLGAERSYPALRDQPPRIEFGDSFSRPESVARPETGITIEIPRQWGALYSVAPIAYYLAADLRPVDADVPVLFAGETSVAIGGGSSRAGKAIRKPTIGQAAETLLTHLFIFDSMVREEGMRGGIIRECSDARSVLESEGISIDTEALYRIDSLEERTERYLSYPIGICNRTVRWFCSGDVEPKVESATMLPRLLEDLTQLHSPPRDQTKFDEEMQSVIDSFFGQPERELTRGEVMYESGETETGTIAPPTPSIATNKSESEESNGRVVSPIVGDHQQAVAVGDDYPMWASKPVQQSDGSYRPISEGCPGNESTVWVICNDSSMDPELLGEMAQMDSVSLARDVTVARLREIITDGCQFLHYIGHVGPDGFLCEDGKLDAHSLDTCDVDAFFLNSCSSYEQGEALVRRGSYGGVVTTGSVLNREAISFGQSFLDLLSSGFSIGAAMQLLKSETSTPPRYMILGDWRVSVAGLSQPPRALIINGGGVDTQSVSVRAESYGSAEWPAGSEAYSPTLDQLGVESCRWLSPGQSETTSHSVGEVVSALEDVTIPIVVRGKLYSGGDVPYEAVARAARVPPEGLQLPE